MTSCRELWDRWECSSTGRGWPGLRGESRQPDPHCGPLWLSCSDSAEASLSATPSSVTWTQVSGLQPLVEPCLRQTLKLLPSPEMWSALGPVPTACLLFLDAYYQAWSQQVSVACLPSTLPWVPCLHLSIPPSFSLCLHLSVPPSPFPPFPSYLSSSFHLHVQWSFQGVVLIGTIEPQTAAQPPWSLYAPSRP